jgi:rubrerythrin
MNGIEVEGAFFSHQFARHTADLELRKQLAMVRRIEQQQQKAVNWLLPGDESALQTTIGYEQVAVDLTAFLARTEPDPYIKQAFEFGLLEDFDHLYRYANLLDMLEGKKADDITGQLTEIMPGRPTVAEHRHPYDEVRNPSDRNKANPLSLLHVLTLVAAEQQTMNYYMNVGNIPINPLARGLYLEIAQIEEQHVTHYESLLDPNASWFEREVLHQYNECYLYYSFMQQETDSRIKQLWELHLNMELEHLRLACDMLRRYDNKEPEEFLPSELPEPIRFEDNKEYVRQVLANQVDLTSDGTEFVPVQHLPEDARYFEYQRIVNTGGVPSEQVIEQHIQQVGKDYRSQTEGKHPVTGARR